MLTLSYKLQKSDSERQDNQLAFRAASFQEEFCACFLFTSEKISDANPNPEPLTGDQFISVRFPWTAWVRPSHFGCLAVPSELLALFLVFLLLYINTEFMIKNIKPCPVWQHPPESQLLLRKQRQEDYYKFQTNMGPQSEF